MAILVNTQSPAALLVAIKDAIDKGHIVTWSYDADGDFTHTPDQWARKAWLRPKIESGELRFGILGRTDEKLSKLIYGVYHGRFIEMLLTHFDDRFVTANATASVQYQLDVVT